MKNMLLSKRLYSQSVDAELFLLVKKSDAHAFEELYNRYWPALVNTTYKKLNSKEKAEDLVQNVFADLYRRRLTIELTTSLKAYLFQALKFKVINEYRSQHIRINYQKKFLFFSDKCEIDFANSLEAKELETRINSILNGLPEKCKKVFFLSRQKNLSNRDISTDLNITISTVEKHISKALKTLRGEVVFT